MTLTLITFAWLPDFPRGFVRDMRVRWVLEEIGRAYRVETVPAHPKSEAHRGMHPFTQVPLIRDGELTLFESGAILMHLGESSALLPEARRPVVTQWLFAALNTVELATSHWMLMLLAERFPDFFGPAPDPAVKDHARQGVNARLAALEQVMSARDWLDDAFSIADIAMIDVLRVLEIEDVLKDYPALRAYVIRGTARPAFQRAMADHMAHWDAADAARTSVAST